MVLFCDVTLDLHETGSFRRPVPERSAALRQLATWRGRAREYGRNRHLVLPGHPWVSGLSPYVRHRLLLEEEVVEDLSRTFSPNQVGKFIEEVAWRTYWKGWMELHPQVWTDYRTSLAALADESDDRTRKACERALAGESGIGCFDAWVEELRETGYLHNQVRMWFASIWIFTLRLPWEVGAAFFLRHLLDGDPAVNTLSWRWVGGLQTRGKTYLARPELIRLNSEGRFFPAGELVTQATPLEGPPNPPAQTLAQVQTTAGLDHSDLSESPVGLLVTGEDLRPEWGVLAETPLQSVAAFAPRDIFAAADLAEPVRAFARDALSDAAHRSAHHWGGTHFAVIDPVELAKPVSEHKCNASLHAPMRIYSGEVDAWVPAVTAWARRERLRTVRLLEPPVGFWRDRLGALRSALNRYGITLKCYRRRWDALHWPHASKGFYPFREGLPERLADFFAERSADQ